MLAFIAVYICIIPSYRSSWLGMGVLGAFSCCTGDAFASALGARLANDGDVFLITTSEKVPKVVFFYEFINLERSFVTDYRALYRREQMVESLLSGWLRP